MGRKGQATMNKKNGQITPPARNNTEFTPPPRNKKRYLTVEYKQRVLAEIEALPQGQIGAYLRQEGLYSTQIAEWRKQQAAGKLKASGPSPADKEAQKRLAELERENAELRNRLAQAELVIAVQKKLARTLESLSLADGEK